MTFLVGSRHEDYGETGMAHLLEHMLFKGTARRRKSQELTDHGASSNGTDVVRPHQLLRNVPATDENLTWALGLEAERMVNCLIAKKDLDSEMTVVRNEFERGENNPTRRADQEGAGGGL